MKELDVEDFEFIRELVYRESGIALDGDMDYLVASRLTTLVRKTKLNDIRALVAAIRSTNDRALIDQVVSAMTTNETSFFRDSHPYETLCQDILPSIAKLHDDTINIWSAACCTGQEVYTIAMSIYERCPQLASRVNIIGTDISSDVIEKAKSGKYTRLEVNRGLPVQLLVKYFVQSGLSWEVSDKLKKITQFDVLNLIEEWDQIPKMDVIFLRNVLIYFDPKTKAQVLQNTSRLLKPGGCLFLGVSETTLNLQTNYTRITTDCSHYYKVA